MLMGMTDPYSSPDPMYGGPPYGGPVSGGPSHPASGQPYSAPGAAYPPPPPQDYPPAGGYQQAAPGYPPGQGQYDPATGQPLSNKSKIVAGILQLCLGSFGAGRFYTGHTGMAIGQIAVTWLTCGLGAIWPIIDGIMLLVNGGTDAEGYKLRD